MGGSPCLYTLAIPGLRVIRFNIADHPYYNYRITLQSEACCNRLPSSLGMFELQVKLKS